MAVASRTQTRQWTVDINATFEGLSDDLMIVTEKEPVRLKLAATPSVDEDNASAKVVCRFDLAGLKRGTHRLSIEAAMVELPKGVSLITPLTSAVTVRLEKKTSRMVDVLPQLEGDPAPGFAVATVRLKPDQVRLTGTKAMLEALGTVRTLPINLKERSESFKQEIPLNIPETIGVEPPSRLVIAEIDIRPKMVTRRLENLPLAARGTSFNYRIEPETISLAVSGPEAVVSRIESDPAFSVAIDLDGLAPGTHRLKAGIKLPLDTTLVQATPEFFTVTISKP